MWQGGADSGEIQVLLIEDNSRDARLVQLVLGKIPGETHARGGFLVTHVARCQSALDLLGDGKRFDVALLDLQLPDSMGLETLVRVRAASPALPIVVLTGLDDDGLALASIRQGAQDWLSKEELDGRRLARALRHAIERKRIEVELARGARDAEASCARIDPPAVQQAKPTEQTEASLVRPDLDEFTYIASHELKEPLFGIRAYCEIMLEDYEDQIEAEGVRRLKGLIDLCDRLADRIEHLLTFCRVGSAENPRHQIDLAQVVEDQLDALGPMIGRRGAVVEIVNPLPVVLGDAALLGTVLANLISNALKYNKSDVPHIQIGRVEDKPGTFFVRDNGIGIEPKYHEEVFALFRRLHSCREYEGTGAGLTIVLRIVQRLGGRIWLESEPGRGSTFYVSLPPAERPVPLPTTAPHWFSHMPSVSPR